LPIIQKLIEKGALTVHEELVETYKPKLVRYVRLSKKYENESTLSDLLVSIKGAKQNELILQYFQMQASEKKPIAVASLLKQSQATTSTLRSLIEKEVFEEYYLEQNRINFNGRQSDENLELSSSQQIALEKIRSIFMQKDVCLLHGVTSSGKTEIYIKLIEDYLTTDQQVLYLLPEIGLTVQLVNRLRSHFGNRVAVFHSKYSSNERVEIWHQVRNNEKKAQVVIGARSALFLPFSKLGLIIVDEEHETTFKQQDPAPRYHARDAAIVLASMFKAQVLLGSATPSVETYFNAMSGKYGLVEIKERYRNVQLPEIELVDLKDKYFRKKVTGHFSDTLIAEITNALNSKAQVILFQNRRGFSPIVECITCGHIPQCIQCDVSLTFHKAKNQLRCHYCGYATNNPKNCHSCSSVNLSTKGFGTEQIQQELELLFPENKIGRLDQDTTRGKFGFEKIIDEFKNGEIEILVGTQMLAKGLDFDNVQLVGVMNADNMLYHPDFRAFERTFQMLTQVAGRSGRSEKRGKVIIQTYNPSHPTILQITRNDYLGMYQEQIKERAAFYYPPYYRLIKVTLKNRDYEKLRVGSEWLHKVFSQHLKMPVLGPEEPVVSKIRNNYIRTILIKIPSEQPLSKTKKTIQKILDSFENISQFRAISVTLNVDFY
jgi:primosomal protein N' (replication factor Y)